MPGLYNLYLCLEKGMHMGSDVCVILYTLTSLVLALTVCLLGAGLTGGWCAVASLWSARCMNENSAEYQPYFTFLWCLPALLRRCFCYRCTQSISCFCCFTLKAFHGYQQQVGRDVIITEMCLSHSKWRFIKGSGKPTLCGMLKKHSWWARANGLTVAAQDHPTVEKNQLIMLINSRFSGGKQFKNVTYSLDYSKLSKPEQCVYWRRETIQMLLNKNEAAIHS